MDCNKKDKLIVLSLVIMNIIFFFGIGQQGYIEMDDTPSYCLPNLIEGIMPVYPFLINVCRIIFGIHYLDAVAALQGLLASALSTIFPLFLKKKFKLKYWEVFLLWLATILPFSIEIPRYIVTHVIYTEGITYSLFYVYVMVALNTLLEKERRWLCLTFAMAVFMGLIRPQLMLLLIISCILFMYKLFLQKERKPILSLVAGVILSVLIIGLGVGSVFQIRAFYVNNVGAWFEQRFEEAEKIENEEERTENIQQVNSFGQVGSALICRAFYEAEADDYQHYDDPDMQEMFLRIYNKCDRKQILYPYAKEGLWMWEDLTQTDIYHVASREIGDYLKENYPDLDANELAQKIAQIKISMAIKEMQLHFGRFIYHCIRLMIPGFIACIFFNIEKIYLLCHIIVLFLYVSGGAMAIWILRNRKEGIHAAKFMLASIASCIVFVGVVNCIFFGMQRYFIYNMGVFYCAYYMVFRECFLKGIRWKKFHLF